jgi:tetratricopeptide (TPR) repeat protein
MLVLLLAPTVPLLPIGFTSLLTQAQSNQSRKYEAKRLNQQGRRQYQQAEYRKAIESFQKAFTLYQAIGDRAGEGQSLNNIGGIYYRLGQYPRRWSSISRPWRFSKTLAIVTVRQAY